MTDTPSLPSPRSRDDAEPARARCDEWIHKGTRKGVRTRQCSRLAAQLFVWWADDPAKRAECLYCREHALRAQRDASDARIAFHRTDTIPADAACVPRPDDGGAT